MKRLIYLQRFADGGEAGAASGTDATAETTGVEGASPVAQGVEGVANPTEDKSKLFDAMIKKGGEYHEEYNKRFQESLNKRFKETKALEDTVKSHSQIMEALALKYGKKADDIEGITKALENDNSMYEELAFNEGLSVEQYKEREALRRENERLKANEEQARQQQESMRIYSEWETQANEVAQKYGVEIDLQDEINSNPIIPHLLANGFSFEDAYFSAHHEDVTKGAMAATAANVEKAVANRVASRHSRPAENGISSSSTSTMTPDVSKMDLKDIRDIFNRARNGEEITFRS